LSNAFFFFFFLQQIKRLNCFFTYTTFQSSYL